MLSHIHCTLSLFLSLRAFTIDRHLGRRGSTCVEVMITLHGSAPSLRRSVGGCVPLEGTISPTRDPLKTPTLVFYIHHDLVVSS